MLLTNNNLCCKTDKFQNHLWLKFSLSWGISGYTRCPQKKWDLLLLLQAVNPTFFWDTLYLCNLFTEFVSNFLWTETIIWTLDWTWSWMILLIELVLVLSLHWTLHWFILVLAWLWCNALEYKIIIYINDNPSFKQTLVNEFNYTLNSI